MTLLLSGDLSPSTGIGKDYTLSMQAAVRNARRFNAFSTRNVDFVFMRTHLSHGFCWN
jgi:hypothetical protein